MFRPPSSRALAFALTFGAAAAVSTAARADAELDVSGEVIATAPRLELRVLVTNRGDQPAPSIDLTGELLGERRARRIPTPLDARQSAAVVLDFDVSSAPQGVHALTLLLEHPLPGTPDAAGNPPLASQRAWLLVALGAPVAPALRIGAEPATIEVRGDVAASLESADGRPHCARLRALCPRGLRAEAPPVRLDVPATGALRTRLAIQRAGAPRGSRHGVLLVAETCEAPVWTSVVAVPVEVAPDHAWLPRLRRPLLALVFVLLAVVVGAEVVRIGRPRS